MTTNAHLPAVAYTTHPVEDRAYWTGRSGHTYQAGQAQTFEEAVLALNPSSKRRSDKTLHFPADLDCEWTANTQAKQGRPHDLLSMQVRPVDQDVRIYTTRSLPGARPLDEGLDCYLLQPLKEDLGWQFEIRYGSFGRRWMACSDRPVLKIVTYSYWAVVDIFKAFKQGGEGLQLLKEAAAEGYLHDSPRMRTGKDSPRQTCTIKLPYAAFSPQDPERQNGWQVELEIIDAGALMGKLPLVDVAETVGVQMPFKDLVTPEEKARMDSVMDHDPERFLSYAAGDCVIHDILHSYEQIHDEVCTELGLEDAPKPKMTIGSTVSQIINLCLTGALLKAGADKQCTKQAIEHASIPRVLERLEGEGQARAQAGALLAKVFGGRCINARPLHTTTEGVICDTDIKGAYSSSMSAQAFAVGRYEDLTPNPGKQGITLGHYAKSIRPHVPPGLEFLILDVPDELPESQNFIASQIDPHKGDETSVKILTHQITHAPITSAEIDWILKSATPTLRRHILKKGRIIAGAYYDERRRIDLDQAADLDTQENWIALPMGELLIDKLSSIRARHPKAGHEGATSETVAKNSFAKLLINAAYGSCASRHFTIGNVVAMNNVTSRVRLMAWAMETALHGYQTITDGTAWNLDSVLHGTDAKNRTRTLDSTHHQLHRLTPDDTRNHGYRLAPIGASQVAGYEWDKEDIIVRHHDGTYTRHEHIPSQRHPFLNVLDRQIIPYHLTQQHPRLASLPLTPDWLDPGSPTPKTLFDLFTFESKDLYSLLATSGASDYANLKPDGQKGHKKRSYKAKDQTTEAVRDHYLGNMTTPTAAPLPPVFIEADIISCGNYRQSRRRYRHTTLAPGDTEERART